MLGAVVSSWPEIARVLTTDGRYLAQYVGPARACGEFPTFDTDRYEAVLRRIDETIRADGSLVAHSTRHLIEARRARPRIAVAPAEEPGARNVGAG